MKSIKYEVPVNNAGTVLVTGGAGYIGSHASVELLAAGYRVVIFDSFCNSHPEVIKRIERITGKQPVCVRGDVRDRTQLDEVFARHRIDTVMHFAGLKAVAESVAKPLGYYDNNVIGTHRLLEAMLAHGVRNFVFSSSATVYGQPQILPYRENHPLLPESPYGRSKLIVEDMLRDLHRSEPDLRIAILRYFNPVGAHSTGLIGEDPKGIPNNLMPYIAQVALGRREQLNIFGGDYPTVDGTGVRDYIHVMDLAEGHVAAIRYLAANTGLLTVNLGTGTGISVLEMLNAFERASGRVIPRAIVARRPGDIAEYYADPSLANTLLDWRASRGVEAMCADTWRWQQSNPQGYAQ